MENLAGRRLGAYVLESPIGAGGMAVVYRALQTSVNRHVALKILHEQLSGDPEFVKRFQREVAILARLKHPGVLAIIDFGQADGYTYLVTPLVDGGTLADRLSGEPLALPELLRIVDQVGQALDYAHGKGVVHRDIKPSNILLDETDHCLLADFGIAREAESGAKLTLTGTQLGTPAYMSPEQAEGEAGATASDVYSLGIVLYELATGRVPFKAPTPVAVAVKHLTATVPPPTTLNPALPPDVEAVILKSLARAPGDRFVTVREMVAALSAAVNGPLAGMRAAPAGRPAAPERPGVPPDDATVLSPRRDKTPVQRPPASPPTPPPTPPPRAEVRKSPYAMPIRAWLVPLLAAAIAIALVVLLFQLRAARRAPASDAAPPATIPETSIGGGAAPPAPPVAPPVEPAPQPVSEPTPPAAPPPNPPSPEEALWTTAIRNNAAGAFVDYLLHLRRNPRANATHRSEAQTRLAALWTPSAPAAPGVSNVAPPSRPQFPPADGCAISGNSNVNASMSDDGRTVLFLVSATCGARGSTSPQTLFYLQHAGSAPRKIELTANNFVLTRDGRSLVSGQKTNETWAISLMDVETRNVDTRVGLFTGSRLPVFDVNASVFAVNDSRYVRVLDRLANLNEAVPATSDGRVPTAAVTVTAMSGNGDHLVLRSSAANLAGGISSSAAGRTYLYGRRTRNLQAVDHDPLQQPPRDGCGSSHSGGHLVTVSEDGAWVVFGCEDDGLSLVQSPPSGSRMHLYARHLPTGRTWLVDSDSRTGNESPFRDVRLFQDNLLAVRRAQGSGEVVYWMRLPNGAKTTRSVDVKRIIGGEGVFKDDGYSRAGCLIYLDGSRLCPTS